MGRDLLGTGCVKVDPAGVLLGAAAGADRRTWAAESYQAEPRSHECAIVTPIGRRAITSRFDAETLTERYRRGTGQNPPASAEPDLTRHAR